MYYKKFIFKVLLSSILILNLFCPPILSQETKIVTKINNSIITNLDIENEYRYLVTLNKQFQNIEKEKLLVYAKDSIIREFIKENELNKYFEIGVEKKPFLIELIKNMYINLGMKSEKEFKIYLEANDLELDKVYKKIEIESAWNQLVYEKYKSQININKEQIKENILENKKEQTIYNLSEIVFSALDKNEFKKKYNALKTNINNLGFDKTAYLYSVSQSQKDSGLLGWVNENQLSKLFRNELTILKKGQTTNPINIPGGKIILKINDKKIELKAINFNEEYSRIVKFETNRQLNKFSMIYFNKIQNNITYEKD
tara:strand:+ start:778 stop:1719 length:942 start_codon:yes stop_codon:yes gene_type:complete